MSFQKNSSASVPFWSIEKFEYIRVLWSWWWADHRRSGRYIFGFGMILHSESTKSVKTYILFFRCWLSVLNSKLKICQFCWQMGNPSPTGGTAIKWIFNWCSTSLFTTCKVCFLLKFSMWYSSLYYITLIKSHQTLMN